MGMSFAYGGQEEKDAIATLQRAVEIGVTFFDTAEVYGPFENEMLLGKALKPVRDQVRHRHQIRLQDFRRRRQASRA